MKGRLGTAYTISGEPVSPVEAHRVITMLQLEGLAAIPNLLHRAETALCAIAVSVAGIPSIDNHLAQDDLQRSLTALRESTSRLLRQMREQRLAIEDLLASTDAMSDAAWIQIETVVKVIWPWRQDGSAPGSHGDQDNTDRIMRALREIDGQLAARVDSLQNCVAQLDQCQLGLNQLRLRRTFHLSAE